VISAFLLPWEANIVACAICVTANVAGGGDRGRIGTPGHPPAGAVSTCRPREVIYGGVLARGGVPSRVGGGARGRKVEMGGRGCLLIV